MNYQHYFILCIPPAIILLCSLLYNLSKHFSKIKWFVRAGVFLLPAVFSLPLIKLFEENYTHREPSAYTKVRDYLIDATVPDESILVWGSRTAIYVMSERYAPTAYFNERPLYLFPEDVQASQWEELLRDIETDPPQVIVYTHDTALPFIMQEQSACIMPDGADYTVPVYDFFCGHYQYETTINPEFQDAWDVFRRK